MELKEAIEQVRRMMDECDRYEIGDKFDAFVRDKRKAALSHLIAHVEKPQDAILFCPKCKEQHVDKAEPDNCELCGHPKHEHFDGGNEVYGSEIYCCDGCNGFTAWLNPPHKKHRCHNCNHVWKPLLIPTNGVKSLQAITEEQP